MVTLHVLHPQAPPPAAFLPIGHTEHQKLAALHAANRFPYRRVIFDAARVRYTRLPAESGYRLDFARAATPTLRAVYPESCGFRVYQDDLPHLLKGSGRKAILDLDLAEMAALRRRGPVAGELPWDGDGASGVIVGGRP
jgi:hypothetical protein